MTTSPDLLTVSDRATTPLGARVAALRHALATRVVVADGAMGTMLQAADLSLDDFTGYEGCNEILNVTRPDVVASVHEAYYAVGVDCVETNTFGANFANLGEYDIAHRIYELAHAGAVIARGVADGVSTPDRQRWVLGSVGPGTKLPTLGHTPYPVLRDAYQIQVAGMLVGGVDAVLIETAQDLLQAKAAVVGARRAITASGIDVPVLVQVTVETTGTMLLGTEIGAALTALEPLGIEMIGLNCATGPDQMSEHLRHLSRHARVGISAMPNAGLPLLRDGGAYYPLSPSELADAHDRFTAEFGLGLVGGCCGTTPEHLKAVVDRVQGRPVTPRRPRPEPGLSSLYQHVPFRQDTTYLTVGERTNANGSRAFRDSRLAGRWGEGVPIARAQAREGAHLVDVCVEYVGRSGVADMADMASRLATAATLPVMVDSTEPEVIEAALDHLGGRCIVNSVNYEDGDGPGSRFARVLPIIVEHGAAVVALCIDETGQARTREHKLAVATRLIEDLTSRWGMNVCDVMVDCLTFPISTGQEETRRDGIETLAAIEALKRRFPDVQTTLGVSNVSFGLNPAARQVLNSVFLHEARQAGLDSAIVHPSRIVPLSRISDEQRLVALDLIYDRRREGYDPLTVLLDMFSGVTATSGPSRAEQLAALPLWERLQRRVVDGEKIGLNEDLDEALAVRPALEIVNDVLLPAMKEVGELFGAGVMQLPFVLTSAEVMKSAVAHLEPHMERSDESGKGTIVLATVKGDVHDIGKNLVDIILTNNGYTVVNLGIKQPVSAILEAAQAANADVVGMSGLLVKSTVIMRENLEEMNARGIAADLPVILGGAALTRAYVEDDLARLYEGEVRYARDAFEGLRLMDALVALKRGTAGPALPALKTRKVTSMTAALTLTEPADMPARSDVARDNPVPVPPFWGPRLVRGMALADYAGWIDERALFLGQWGLKPSRGGDGPGYEELVDTEGRPRLRSWLDRLHTEQMLDAGVAYGYFPVWSEGDEIVVLAGPVDLVERARMRFPRQRRDRHLCLSDFIRSKDAVVQGGRPDVLVMQVVTMGSKVSKHAGALFEANSYREYLELHGLSVQLAEALAERWHARVREELGYAAEDGPTSQMLSHQAYRGSRYSFGYPACPDLEQQSVLLELLEAHKIGLTLSEEHMLVPEQSTSALVFHHPEAKYFNAG